MATRAPGIPDFGHWSNIIVDKTTTQQQHESAYGLHLEVGMITVAVEGKDKKREHHTTPADHRLLLHDIDLPARTDLFSFLHDAAHNCRVWGPYVLHDLKTYE